MRRLVLGLAILVTSVFLACVDRRRALERLIDVVAIAESMGYVGMIFYIAIFVISTLLMVPTAPLDMAAGFLFSRRYGLWVAAVLAVIGKQASGALAFVLGRTLLHQYVRETVLPRFPCMDAITTVFEKDAFTMTCMVRFAPLPTIAKSLCLAVSGVPLYTFLAASTIFAVPWSIAGALVGSTLVSLPDLIDGHGEEKLKELLQSWKDRPGIMGTALVLLVVFLAYACHKVLVIYGMYKDLIAKSEEKEQKRNK